MKYFCLTTFTAYYLTRFKWKTRRKKQKEGSRGGCFNEPPLLVVHNLLVLLRSQEHCDDFSVIHALHLCRDFLIFLFRGEGGGGGSSSSSDVIFTPFSNYDSPLIGNCTRMHFNPIQIHHMVKNLHLRGCLICWLLVFSCMRMYF